MIKGTPSEISEIVSRSRKDFTKEFFVHLHTLVESYSDDPKAQNGETECFQFQFNFYLTIFLAFKYPYKLNDIHFDGSAFQVSRVDSV